MPPPPRVAADTSDALLAEVRACTGCAAHLPHGPRPVLQWHPQARLLIAAQAPGRRVHESGVPFDDASGERLRRWLGLDRADFHDPRRVAIVPMGLCYPGRGIGGDRPPRPECAPRWRGPLLQGLRAVRLTLVVGAHAMRWHLPGVAGVTEAVRDAGRRDPTVWPLPHPSPANHRWFARHPWFEAEIVPALRARVAALLAEAEADANTDAGDRGTRPAPLTPA